MLDLTPPRHIPTLPKAGRSLVVAILGSKARAVAATRAKIRASGRNVHVFDGPGFGRKGPRH